jgi:hypothetical protein
LTLLFVTVRRHADADGTDVDRVHTDVQCTRVMYERNGRRQPRLHVPRHENARKHYGAGARRGSSGGGGASTWRPAGNAAGRKAYGLRSRTCVPCVSDPYVLAVAAVRIPDAVRGGGGGGAARRARRTYARFAAPLLFYATRRPGSRSWLADCAAGLRTVQLRTESTSAAGGHVRNGFPFYPSPSVRSLNGSRR